MREGDYFRISSLYKLCAREEVLASREEIPRVESIAPGLQITFDIGDCFHDLYRDQYWGPMGEWLGAWECKRCGWNTDVAGLSHAPIKGKRSAKLATMPDQCPQCKAVRYKPCPDCGQMRGSVCTGCGSRRDGVPDDAVDIRGDGVITFMEWSVKADDIRLGGHPDGWRKDGMKRRISDLKSHGSNGFIRRTSPRNGHDLQVWGYQYCADEVDKPGEVCYLNKSPWGDHTSFIRDMVMPFDKGIFEAQVKKPLIELQEGLSGGALPGKICVSAGCPRAKDCQLAAICWNK